jgi:hypothetical protein
MVSARMIRPGVSAQRQQQMPNLVRDHSTENGSEVHRSRPRRVDHAVVENVRRTTCRDRDTQRTPGRTGLRVLDPDQHHREVASIACGRTRSPAARRRRFRDPLDLDAGRPEHLVRFLTGGFKVE